MSYFIPQCLGAGNWAKNALRSVYRSVSIIDETSVFDLGHVGYTMSMLIYAENSTNEIEDSTFVQYEVFRLQSFRSLSWDRSIVSPKASSQQSKT
jgi:hypothetical protein